jgi:hypothetical protein
LVASGAPENSSGNEGSYGSGKDMIADEKIRPTMDSHEEQPKEFGERAT